MSFLDHIRACNNADMTAFRPFVVAGRRVGWLRHDFAERLRDWPEVFAVAADSVELSPDPGGFAARGAALAPVLRALADAGLVTGWRDELYPVTPSWGAPPLLAMERAACPRFGVRARGVHMTGYVRRPEGPNKGRDGGLHLWVARRARGKPTFPGMLDNTVAGGQPIGITPRDNMIKECAEEAGIPAALCADLRAVGMLSYRHQPEDGLKPDQIFSYDLELPEDFTPVNQDGEIESFELWPVAEVAARVRDSADFKFNCNLVLIDFLIRHGILTPENEPDYAEIALGLRRGD